MPPSRHSGSSHSSSPRPSGSSRGSSRSPSSHSSSSRSSTKSGGSYSSSFLSRPSPYKTPSRHTADSHGSERRERAFQPAKPRERVNQPTGSHQEPRYYDGKRHSYAYYPESWTDAATGRRFERGYYDEAGRRYDAVCFARGGRYENVLCHCPYCGQDSVRSLNAGEDSESYLKCPNCGGPMELRSQLDELVTRQTGNTHVYNSEESLRPFLEQARRRRRRRRISLVAAVLLALCLAAGLLPSAVSRFLGQGGRKLYLRQLGALCYELTDKDGGWDKALVWDADAESWYDAESDCWLWFNTEVEPAVWQYWYEGVSSDFEDWGWMEHEDGGWYIEESIGRWIALPARYDASALWYMADAHAG